jgi:MFS family permease
MDSYKDTYFTRNVCGVAAVEFFWGLGFPIVLESTFLQLFLRNLGASSFAIGIVPSIFIVGISCFPLFSSYLSRNKRFKKKTVLLLHLVSALSIFLFGWTLLLVNETAILPLFYISYAIFSLCMGLTIPVWLNYLVRIFSEGKTVPGLGYMMLSQNVGKVISSFFILKVVEKYAFSVDSSAIIFIVTGLVFIIGSLCFAFTKEIADKNDPKPDRMSFLRHTRQHLAEIIKNRQFLIFLIADLDFYVIITVLSFYANYAAEYFGVKQAVAAGVFVGCIYAGSITVNILLGTLDYLSIKQKFTLSKCITLTALMLLIVMPGNWSFFIISYLLGCVRAIRNMVYTPSVKKLSGMIDATPYFALAPILTLPIGVGYPLLFGKMLDHLAFMGAASYKVLYGFSALFILFTLFFTFLTQFDDKTEIMNE